MSTNELKAMALPVMRSLARVRHWALNPRSEGFYRGIPELEEDLVLHGLQDALHVWETPEADWVLKGNRRTKAMSNLGWTECAQVVHHFTDEREALEFCLSDHGHTDPLDNGEKIQAVETALRIGVSSAAVAQCLGVNADRVQLWFALAESLPAVGRTALSEGTLSMNTAEMLIKLEDAEERSEVLQLILHNPETRKPMKPADAEMEIEARLAERRNHAEWEKLRAKLTKVLKVIDGHQYIGWSERGEYILDDSGSPCAGYQYATSRESEDGTFGQAAEKLNVPRLVVPAPWRMDKHVVLVNVKMLRLARDTGGGMVVDGGMVDGGDEGAPVEGEFSLGRGAVVPSPLPVPVGREVSDEKVKAFMVRLWTLLMTSPTEIMGKDPWVPVLPFLFAGAEGLPEGEGRALAAWLGSKDEARLFFEQDRKARWYLRQAYVLTVCAQLDAAADAEVVMGAIAEAVGMA